jgi:hypothetical protein
MKQIIFLEIMKQLKSKPQLMKKLKIFAFVGLVGFIFLGGLTIWLGIKALNYTVNTASTYLSSPTTQEQISKVNSEIQELQFQPHNCWNKAQSLLAIQPWLEKPALENLKNLKTECVSKG